MELKPGARVILLQNLDLDPWAGSSGLANGSQGTVLRWATREEVPPDPAPVLELFAAFP